MERAQKERLAAAANVAATRSRRYPEAYPVLSADSSGDTVAEWLQLCDPNGTHTRELCEAESEACDPYEGDEAWDALDSMLSDN